MVEQWDIYDENGLKTGRLHKPGKPLQKGEYHLVVHVWILNNKDEFLIQKRIPGTRDISGKWETVGGHAIAGEDSIQAAVREAYEEIGVNLDPTNGRLYIRRIEEYPVREGSARAFCDVWIFRQEIDIKNVVLNPDETCDVMWAGPGEVLQMVEDGIFRTRKCYPYIDDLLSLYKEVKIR